MDAHSAEHHQDGVGCVLWGAPPEPLLDPWEAASHSVEVWY